MKVLFIADFQSDNTYLSIEAGSAGEDDVEMYGDENNDYLNMSAFSGNFMQGSLNLSVKEYNNGW